MRRNRYDDGRSLFTSSIDDWEINWSDSITAGLIFCISPMLNTKMVDTVSGKIGVAGSVSGAAIPSSNIKLHGVGYAGSDIAHPCVDFPNPSTQWGSINSYSMFSFQDWPGYNLSNVGNILDQDNNGGSPRVFQFRLNTAPRADFIVFNTGGGVIQAQAEFFSTSEIRGGWTQVGVIDARDSTVRVFAKSTTGLTSIGGANISGTVRGLDLSTNLTVFNVNGGTEQVFNGTLYIAGIWRRSLSVAEAHRLCVNPFCFITRRGRYATATVAAVAATPSRRGILLP